MRNNSENFQTNQVALNNATLSYGNVPSGTIVSWCHDAQINSANTRLQASNSANIPDGWVVCDGRSYTKTDGTTGYTPNLVGKFIYGGKGQAYANVNSQSGNTGEYNGGNAFGGQSMYTQSQHTNHTVIMDSGGKYKVALNTNQIPAHTHSGTTRTDEWIFQNGDRIPTSNHRFTSGLLNHAPDGYQNFQAGGQGTNHRHIHDFTTDNGTGGGEAHNNMPPYYTLVFIMKKY